MVRLKVTKSNIFAKLLNISIPYGAIKSVHTFFKKCINFLFQFLLKAKHKMCHALWCDYDDTKIQHKFSKTKFQTFVNDYFSVF